MVKVILNRSTSSHQAKKKNFIYNIAFEKMDQEFFLDLCPMGNTQQDAPTTMLRFTGNGVPRAQVAPEYNLEVSEQQA